MSQDQRSFDEKLREANESIRRYLELSDRDPGCQRSYGPYRRAEIVAASAGDFCPACQCGGCEKKREVLAYQECGGHFVAHHYGPCGACGKDSQTIERHYCKCCCRLYFVCSECRGLQARRSGTPKPTPPRARPTEPTSRPHRLNWLQALRYRLELLKLAIHRARQP